MKKFEGVYVKCVGPKNSMAVIFGRQVCKKESSAFMQIITKENSYYINFPAADYFSNKKGFYVRIGKNYVNHKELVLNINSADLTITGKITFEKFSPLKYNVMGPLKYLPFMQCKHKIVSMNHFVSGQVSVNRHELVFANGLGYIEGDKGNSFPKKYFWTQCNAFNQNNLSVSAACATVPYLGIKFTGTVCVVHYNGREYRLASYLGARVIANTPTMLVVKQRKLYLEAEVLDSRNGRILIAPNKGQMNRTIEESIERTVRYKFVVNGKELFNETSLQAAFEFSET